MMCLASGPTPAAGWFDDHAQPLTRGKQGHAAHDLCHGKSGKDAPSLGDSSGIVFVPPAQVKQI